MACSMGGSQWEVNKSLFTLGSWKHLLQWWLVAAMRRSCSRYAWEADVQGNEGAEGKGGNVRSSQVPKESWLHSILANSAFMWSPLLSGKKKKSGVLPMSQFHKCSWLLFSSLCTNSAQCCKWLQAAALMRASHRDGAVMAPQSQRNGSWAVYVPELHQGGSQGHESESCSCTSPFRSEQHEQSQREPREHGRRLAHGRRAGSLPLPLLTAFLYCSPAVGKGTAVQPQNKTKQTPRPNPQTHKQTNKNRSKQQPKQQQQQKSVFKLFTFLTFIWIPKLKI